MERLTTTPFGRRPMSADLISQAATASGCPDLSHTDKWEVFRQICTARVALGVTDRALTVLNALLSFYPEVKLSDQASLIVFPSNRTLGERAHGMAESTLRRHLAALVAAGLVWRHDSPNGKRYARRNRDGDMTRAFGFDLRPLLLRAAEFAQAAQAAEDAAERRHRIREQITLTKRDALKLASYAQEQGMPGDWADILAALMDVHKAMRRNLVIDQLEKLLSTTTRILDHVTTSLRPESEEPSGCDSQNERHYQNSDTYYSVSEQSLDKPDTSIDAPSAQNPKKDQTPRPLPKLPLHLVLKACPDIEPYLIDDIRRWHDLIKTAALLRGMMGISPTAWDEAQTTMGPESAAVVVCCILQRFSSIRNPGGYLRALSAKAVLGTFSPAPMVMALLNGELSKR
ncbi:plasmid replication protein RepC [Pseudoruegeria sp. SK021]|uniref:plasmid replication protein RepC n=1 Tax=Pseudoruegeria sp. SK021 TaxID=1933035 RepID=UPI000A253D27|nr:plasmid replication protein RepC [Pseudoruegeria sp. SK021]OSP54142.1 hypothetical protein BV911_14315 [Pseudoruegeria sp. SK021]